MKFEKSAGAVVFRELRVKNQEPREYLLLAHNSMGKVKKVIWDFPKGLMAEGESERSCAQREVAEETGVTEFSFVDGFRETLKIFFKYKGEFINKTVVYFLTQTTSDDVRISLEHTDFVWLPFEKALERLTFKNSREILKKSEDNLNGIAPVPPQPSLL